MARQKPRLPTSREVYNAIRWDPRHDPTAFAMVYEERFSGMREIPLVEFSPNGEIPWHRVWAIRRNGEIIWDRKARIYDLGPQLGVPSPPLEQVAPSEVEAVENRPLQVWRFDTEHGAWRPATELSAPASPLQQHCEGLLRVATFNVLNPALAGDIPSPTRARAISTLLQQLDADLIGLQEATPPFMTRLLQQDWVRRHYQICTLPEGTRDEEHGQVLLSRLPITSATRVYTSHRKHLLLVDAERAGHPLAVAVLHLSSALASGAEALRARQLRTLLGELERRGGDSLVLGDFNCEDDELTSLHRGGWRDIWTTLRPQQPGLSFDPTTNSLAAATSRSGLARRYDRVLWRASGDTLRAVDIRLFGERPLPTPRWRGGPLFPSDHYGLCASLRDGATLEAGLDAPPSYRSAVVLLPPESSWAPIQAIRAQHDRSFERWMPHINLLYGFLPEESFAAAAALIAGALQQLEPFWIELARFGRFDHRNGSSLWLDPEALPESALTVLQGVLERLFPQCDELARRGEGGFRPHLTVGAFSKRSGSDLPRLQRRLEASWTPLEFEVGHVALISRRDDQPFVVRALIPLARRDPEQSPKRSPDSHDDPTELLEPWSAAAAAARASAQAQLETLSSEAVPGSNLRVSGSVRTGVDLPGSDLDLVWICPPGTERSAAQLALADGLNRDARAHAVQLVGGKGETLRCVVDEQPVDVQLVVAPNGALVSSPLAWSPAQCERLTRAGALALQGLRDAQALEAFGAEHGCWPLIQAGIKLLKQWARARDLDTTALGFLGGISWSVIVAWSCSLHEAAPISLDALIATVFADLDAWDGQAPLALDNDLGDWQRARRDKLAILSPALAKVNTARHVTPSTLRVLAREWQRGHELTAEHAWKLVLEPVPAPVGRRILCRVEADTPALELAARGWLRGTILGLILALEQRCGAHLRPRRGGLPAPWELCLVLESGSPATNVLREALDRFSASFPWKPDQARLVLELGEEPSTLGSS